MNAGKWLVLKKYFKDEKDGIVIPTQLYLGQIGNRNIFRQKSYPQILSQVLISAFTSTWEKSGGLGTAFSPVILNPK